jgi:hypothetical protein
MTTSLSLIHNNWQPSSIIPWNDPIQGNPAPPNGRMEFFSGTAHSLLDESVPAQQAPAPAVVAPQPALPRYPYKLAGGAVLLAAFIPILGIPAAACLGKQLRTRLTIGPDCPTFLHASMDNYGGQIIRCVVAPSTLNRNQASLLVNALVHDNYTLLLRNLQWGLLAVAWIAGTVAIGVLFGNFAMIAFTIPVLYISYRAYKSNILKEANNQLMIDRLMQPNKPSLNELTHPGAGDNLFFEV